MTDLATAIQTKNWYAIAAIVLMLLTQIVRKKQIPLLTAVWNKIPNGFRFVLPLLAGAATGFGDGFLAGLPLRGAVMQAIAGALGIGVGAMGLAAVLKESPIPWDGKAGGVKPPLPVRNE